MTFTKKKIDNVFVLSKLIDITVLKKNEVEIVSSNEEVKEEKQISMSDFLDVFKI